MTSAGSSRRLKSMVWMPVYGSITPTVSRPGATSSEINLCLFLSNTMGLFQPLRKPSSTLLNLAKERIVSISGDIKANGWFFLPFLRLNSSRTSSRVASETRCTPPIPLTAMIFPSMRSFAVSVNKSLASMDAPDASWRLILGPHILQVIPWASNLLSRWLK